VGANVYKKTVAGVLRAWFRAYLISLYLLPRWIVKPWRE
jgi:hypothetical protein